MNGNVLFQTEEAHFMQFMTVLGVCHSKVWLSKTVLVAIPLFFCLSQLARSCASFKRTEETRHHRNIVDGAEQQVSLGVAVDLSLSLEHHGLVVQRLDKFGLLLGSERGRGGGVFKSDGCVVF